MLGEIIDDRREVAVPSQRFKISTAMASVLITRSGASRSHSLRVSSYFKRTPRGRQGFDTYLTGLLPSGGLNTRRHGSRHPGSGRDGTIDISTPKVRS